MMVVEYGNDIIIIDAGVMFPDDEMFGVDLVIPDTNYLNDKTDRIRGILITHGHEDHVGGLPYVLPMLDFPPIYATRLTQGLINVKLKEHKLLERATVNVITPGDQLELGKCLVEFFRVNNDSLDKIFANAPGRVLLATFASLISRVQQVVDTAARYQRKVALVGRSMVNNVQMAMELGYLDIPKGMLIRAEDINKFQPEQIVIICTGSQGEPTSALTRIANQDHRLVRIQPNDTVILSATPVPGNEKMVNRTINNLFRQGAEVFYQGISNVHVSGHAAQEELKLMLGLLRPHFFMPVHGEYRQLVLHEKLACTIGIPRDHIVVAEDGDIVEVTPDSIKVASHVASGNVYVDGLGVGDVGHIVLRDRQVLAQDGILMAVLTVDKETGQPLAGPDIVSRGFVYMRDAEELLESARERVLESFIGLNGHASDWAFIKDKIKHTLSEFLYEKTHRRPMILPVVMEV